MQKNSMYSAFVYDVLLLFFRFESFLSNFSVMLLNAWGFAKFPLLFPPFLVGNAANTQEIYQQKTKKMRRNEKNEEN